MTVNIEELKRRTKLANDNAERVNSQRTASLSRIELLHSQFKTYCEKYKATYGVDITETNAEAELQRVAQEYQVKLDLVEKATTLIQQGRIDEANRLLGVEVEPKVARGTDAFRSAEPISQPTQQPVEQVQQPVSQPVVSQPVAQPVVETPVVQPVVNNPVVTQPIAQPIVNQPVAQPTVSQPIAEPHIATPIVNPVASNPTVEQPKNAIDMSALMEQSRNQVGSSEEEDSAISDFMGSLAGGVVNKNAFQVEDTEDDEPHIQAPAFGKPLGNGSAFNS